MPTKPIEEYQQITEPKPVISVSNATAKKDIEGSKHFKPSKKTPGIIKTKPVDERRKFRDVIKINVSAGDGGSGCTSFARAKRVREAPPDGGDGGNGGNVILHTSEINNFRTMSTYHHNAENGKNGSGNNRLGRNGKDKIIIIPTGTIVKDITNVNETIIVADLDKQNVELLIAKGGEGGKGNRFFLSPQNRSPQDHTKGILGEKKIRIRIKINC